MQVQGGSFESFSIGSNSSFQCYRHFYFFSNETHYSKTKMQCMEAVGRGKQFETEDEPFFKSLLIALVN